MKQKGSLLSAALLLAGYCIGTGYYSLPSATGPAGFFPAVGMLLIVWVYLLASGLLYLEATLANPEGANVITICRNLIGQSGMVIATIAFVIINYTFLVHIFLITSDSISYFLSFWLHLQLHINWIYLGIALLIGSIVFWGTYVADRVNFVLFAGLILAFIGVLVTGSKGVQLDNLLAHRWYLVVFTVPVLVTAIDFQGLIPTLSTYLKRDKKKLVKMVVLAMLFPLVMYILWLWLAIGSSTRAALWESFEQGEPVYKGYMIQALKVPFHHFLRFTAFFAGATSLVSCGLVMQDFLGDAFHIPVEKRVGKKRLVICGAIFVPILAMGFFIPKLTLRFLEYVFLEYLVGWAEVIFNAAIPIWLIVRARYILKLQTERCLPGGKGAIIALFIAMFFLIYLEGVHILGN
ncbi:MAG: hypothetical protein S4CHLAM2_12260 [Chlamydiales bacterium]|nr:hypothetical protein [Chlamydiales bacterium]